MNWSLPTILFGGSFDPVHEGHLHVAREALRAVPEAKQLVFIPAAHSPGKAAGCASPAQRLEWLRLAVEPEGWKVWDTEVSRGGESYTVDTLQEAHDAGARAERLWWLVGADAYASLPGWRNPERIRELAQILVVSRPGREVMRQSSSDRIVEIAPHPASSTALRARLGRGEKAADWLPAPVSAALERLLPGQNPYVTTDL